MHRTDCGARGRGGSSRKALQYRLHGSYGEKPVSPAKVQLKRLADRLTEEDAGLVLSLARKLASRRRIENRQVEDREDTEDARKALAEPGSTPWVKFKAARGL
jgi:hypothetical protein